MKWEFMEKIIHFRFMKWEFMEQIINGVVHFCNFVQINYNSTKSNSSISYSNTNSNNNSVWVIKFALYLDISWRIISGPSHVGAEKVFPFGAE